MTLTEAREGSAAFVRSLADNAQRLWELPGPKGTAIHALEAWSLRQEGDRPRVVIVQIYGGGPSGRRTESDGWAILVELGPLQIDGTRAVFKRLPEIDP